MTFQDVEKARQKYVKTCIKYIVITLTATILAVSSSLLISSLAIGVVIFTLCIAAVFCAIGIRKHSTAYRKAYKGYFVEQSFKKTFTDLKYQHDAGIDFRLIDKIEMVKTGNVFSSNDLTTAKYKDVLFTHADVHAQNEYNTDDSLLIIRTTVFKGRFMFFKFPKKFNFRLELVGCRFQPYKVPGKSSITGRKMSKISTESNEFNQYFKIFGEDGFESCYILDPSFMVKIKEIAEHYEYKILFGFIDNQLFIALNDGSDSFEPPKAYKSIDEQVEFAKIDADIKIITDFVDQLRLY